MNRPPLISALKISNRSLHYITFAVITSIHILSSANHPDDHANTQIMPCSIPSF
jgi:hypothetical protein